MRDIHGSVRKYVGTAKPARVRTLALQGEGDIDTDNPKQIYFHIQGGRPDAVTLYLRAALFSTLFYTEIGEHSHDLDLETGSSGETVGHTHSLAGVKTKEDGAHNNHEVTARIKYDGTDGDSIRVPDNGTSIESLTDLVDMKITKGAHTHELEDNAVTGSAGNTGDHTHDLTGSTEQIGQTMAVRSGRNPRTYVNEMQVWIDGDDYTQHILDRLGWRELGGGGGNHALVTEGTGAIQLDLLGIDFFEGEHLIELKVETGGGRILYNLYVE